MVYETGQGDLFPTHTHGPGSMRPMTTIEITTERGPARVRLARARDERGAVLLGHGAGGGIDAPDLAVASAAALDCGFAVALVEQPYRVAGRRAPPPAAHLDAAWLTVTAQLRGRELAGLPLVIGGRSMGARVACRTARDAGAVGVICLAFPLLPPRRASARTAPISRQAELDATRIPTLVIQGERDPFGQPQPGPLTTVVTVPGDHSLRAGLDEVDAAVRGWLAGLGGPGHRRFQILV